MRRKKVPCEYEPKKVIRLGEVEWTTDGDTNTQGIIIWLGTERRIEAEKQWQRIDLDKFILTTRKK